MAKATTKTAKRVSPRVSKGSETLSESNIKIVLKYFSDQNRPYNLNDVFNNLHGAVGKTTLQKVVERLVEDGLLVEKNYGRQTIYVIKQDQDDVPSPEELDTMDNEISALKTRLSDLKGELKIISLETSNMKGTPTIGEAKERISKLKLENEFLLNKMKEIESGTRKIDPEEKKRIDMLYTERMFIYKQRKKAFKEIVDTISEGISMRPKEFMEELGLESV